MKRLACLTMLAIVLWATPVLAGSTVNLDLKGVELRPALEALFRAQGCNFAISDTVTGTINLHLDGATFDQALKAMTKIGGLTYRISDNIYIVERKPSDTTVPVAVSPVETPLATTTTVEVRVEKIILIYSTPSDLLEVMNGSIGNEQSSSPTQYPWNQPWNQQTGRQGYQQYPNQGMWQQGGGSGYGQQGPWQPVPVNPAPVQPPVNPTPAPVQGENPAPTK